MTEVILLAKRERNDGTKALYPMQAYASEELAKQRDFYLTDEIEKDDCGNLLHYYRLHSQESCDNNMALNLDVYCPKCHRQMRQITTNLDFHTLGYYECRKCNKKGAR